MTRLTPDVSNQRVSCASASWLLATRVCLAAVFLYSGAAKLVFWSAGIDEFAALDLPMPPLALAATITLQIGAGMALLIGWHTKQAALALAVFTMVATLIGHPFWAFEGADFHRQLTTALEHLAIVGGLFVIATIGPGPFSLQPREHSS